jgi:hypothetical protein
VKLFTREKEKEIKSFLLRFSEVTSEREAAILRNLPIRNEDKNWFCLPITCECASYSELIYWIVQVKQLNLPVSRFTRERELKNGGVIGIAWLSHAFEPIFGVIYSASRRADR